MEASILIIEAKHIDETYDKSGIVLVGEYRDPIAWKHAYNLPIRNDHYPGRERARQPLQNESCEG
jgi:hypothetical protein